MMMALLFYLVLSLIASTLVIFAAALSAHISHRENQLERYENTEGGSDQSKSFCAQPFSQ